MSADDDRAASPSSSTTGCRRSSSATWTGSSRSSAHGLPLHRDPPEPRADDARAVDGRGARGLHDRVVRLRVDGHRRLGRHRHRALALLAGRELPAHEPVERLPPHRRLAPRRRRRVAASSPATRRSSADASCPSTRRSRGRTCGRAGPPRPSGSAAPGRPTTGRGTPRSSDSATASSVSSPIRSASAQRAHRMRAAEHHARGRCPRLEAKPDSYIRIADSRYGTSSALTTKPARSWESMHCLPSVLLGELARAVWRSRPRS